MELTTRAYAAEGKPGGRYDRLKRLISGQRFNEKRLCPWEFTSMGKNGDVAYQSGEVELSVCAVQSYVTLLEATLLSFSENIGYSWRELKGGAAERQNA